MVLLKNDKVKNAIIELEDLHETEEKVYGENSVQVGKTKKILGCVHLGRKNFG
jgi:rRNA processing protein Gar1